MTEPVTNSISGKKRSFVQRAVRICVAFFLTPYLILAGLLSAFQRSLIYHPTADRSLNERTTQLGTFRIEPLTFATPAGVLLNGWRIPADPQPIRIPATRGANDTRLTVLYFCGNAGHRAYRLMDFSLNLDCGCNVVCFDYRGFGDNDGKPSESALAEDAQSIWHYLVDDLRISPREIALMGESLGGGVATRLAAETSAAGTPPAGLILRSTFSSLTDAAAYHFPWLPVRLLLIDRFSSSDRMPFVTCPILIFHGERDSIVPYSLGQKLFAAAPARSSNGIEKRFVSLPHSDHNDVLDTAGGDMRRAIGEFVAQINTR
jgi:fermentation-respiration switch protein FrsA (DUF1100 family)